MANPIPGPNGVMLDPATRQPLRRLSDAQQELGGRRGNMGGANPMMPGGFRGGQ